MRDFFTKDIGWKLFAVALAMLIWFTVRHETIAPATRAFDDVPVLVVSAAADVREFKVNPAVVRVIVSGRPDAVNMLDQRQIHVLVDLTGAEPTPDLKKRVDVSTPPGVTFVSVVPAEVDVVVPPKREK